MPHINLLPWREARQKQKQQQFVAMLSVAVVCAGLLMFAVSYYFQQRIDGQLQRNQFLQQQITVLDQQIIEIRTLEQTKANLQQRIELIEQLQSSRNLGTQIFAAIAQVVPTGIYLEKLEKTDDLILIHGRSESNNRLSKMIRNIEQMELLQFVNLQSITAAAQQTDAMSDFIMQLKVSSFAVNTVAANAVAANAVAANAVAANAVAANAVAANANQQGEP